MVTLFGIFILTLLVITAFAVVHSSNLFVSVMLSGIFSLLMASTFFILDAADVALTEAAVGAGITTVLLLGALALTAEHERQAPQRLSRWVPLLVVAIAAAVIIYASFGQPRLGDPEAPVHQHVAPWYLEKTPEYIDIPNVVTAVLGSYRGYDTLGEVIVVFVAAVGVLFLLGDGVTLRKPQPRADRDPQLVALRAHPIPQVVGRLLIPFILLFGLYVQFHGEYGPGGGFQAGALIGASMILYALLEGEKAALNVIPPGVLAGLLAGGGLLYGAVGIAGMLLGSNFLDYSVLAANPVTGQQVGILLIEAGVGITVTGALLSIFHAFACRSQR